MSPGSFLCFTSGLPRRAPYFFKVTQAAKAVHPKMHGNQLAHFELQKGYRVAGNGKVKSQIRLQDVVVGNGNTTHPADERTPTRDWRW